MKRFYLLLLFLVSFCVSAQDSNETSVLPFWGINISDFHASAPQAVSIPGSKGNLDYYWCWTFKFKYNTNLHELKKHYTEMIERLKQNGADDEAEVIENNIKRIDTSIENIKGTKLHISLLADDGEKINDTGDLIARNILERKLGKKLYTTREISRLDLNSVEESYDRDYGKGKWVEGVAVFSSVPDSTRLFEIKVSGLGKRQLPLFLPGSLLYPASTLEYENAFRPTMQRVLTYQYRKIGQAAALGLTPVQFEGRNVVWEWLWPLQVITGRFREAEVSRLSGLKRKYVYIPYYIWNNTHKDQTMKVLKAGIVEEVVWGGEKMSVVMLDNGGTDARWTKQVYDIISERVSDGTEKQFAAKNENYPVKYSAVNMQDYYTKNLRIEYIPQDPQVQADKNALQSTLKSSDRIVKMQKALDELKAKDIERKSEFLPKSSDTRLFDGTIGSGKIVTGVLIIRWGVEDAAKLVGELISALQAKSLVGRSDGDNKLLAEYNKLCKKIRVPGMAWTRPSEPDRSVVVQMLDRVAREELKEKGIDIADEDVRRYGNLAPVAVLINNLAWDEMVARADKKSITDTFFEVKTGGAVEDSVISTRFQKFLPNEREALPTPPDKFAKEGTKEGVGEGSVEDEVKKTDDKKKSKDDGFW